MEGRRRGMHRRSVHWLDTCQAATLAEGIHALQARTRGLLRLPASIDASTSGEEDRIRFRGKGARSVGWLLGGMLARLRAEARGTGSGLQTSSLSYQKAGKRKSRNTHQWTWSSVQASTSARGLNSYSSGRDAVTGLSLSDGFAAYGMRGLQQEGRKLM